MKKPINQKHKDYPEYQRRREELFKEWEKEIEAAKTVEDQKSIRCGQDGPLTAIDIKYGKLFSALQKEFVRLFK